MPNLLDVDPSILERNLLFKDFEGTSMKDEFSLDSLLNVKPKDTDDIPWKPVKPTPGYCVKLRTLEGDKVFVNVCHTDAIPEPIEISEEKLLQMIMDEDVPSFRIPISIGDLHVESDKSRNPCSVYDIAVNSKFYKKMDTSEVFNTFFLNVSIQALQEKYSLNLDLKSEKPFLLLKNRKCVGTLQVHRIQQREVKKAPGQLIQEIKTNNSNQEKKLIQVISENEKSTDNTIKSQNNSIKSSSNKMNEKISSGKIKPNIKDPNDSNKSIDSCATQMNITKKAPSESDYNLSSANINQSSQLNSQSKKLNNNSEFLKATTPEEKGIKECQITKENIINESNMIEQCDTSDEIDIRSSGDSCYINRQSNSDEMCPGLLCIRKYPNVGNTEVLIASIYLNIKSSREFNLELDSKRLCITLTESNKPWFDITLPYTIDVNNVEACFIKHTQKLMIKMDIIKS